MTVPDVAPRPADAAVIQVELPHEEVGEPVPVRVDRWAHRRAEPRPLALIWTIYLFAATAMTFGAIMGVGGLTLDVYRPALRILLATVGGGVILMWPMIRLSQTAPIEHPAVASMKDFVAIVVPLHAMVWPQWLLAAWPVQVIAGLAMTLTAWAVLTAGLLAWYFRYEIERGAVDQTGQPRPAGGGRAGMMLVFVVLAVLGPVLGTVLTMSGVGVVGGPGTSLWWLLSSPITAVFEISRDRFWTGSAAVTTVAHWATAGGVGVTGLVCWIGAALARHNPGRVRSDLTSA